MIDSTARASGDTEATAQPGIVSVQTRPAKTLPGIAGVLLALVGLGLVAGGGVGVTVAMLRRQQAAAVVAARRTIVEGAVGMVEEALELLSERSVVELDQDAKASLVANLLVVLTSEQPTTPVVNTGVTG